MILTQAEAKPSGNSLARLERAMPMLIQLPIMLAFVYTRDVPGWVKLIGAGAAFGAGYVGYKVATTPRGVR